MPKSSNAKAIHKQSKVKRYSIQMEVEDACQLYAPLPIKQLKYALTGVGGWPLGLKVKSIKIIRIRETHDQQSKDSDNPVV